MKVLVLPLKGKWFEQVKAGTKLEEYRLDNEYWQKRLIGKEFDRVVVMLGYPKATDTERRIEFPWNGYEMKTITSEEWNNEPKRVFAIKLQAEKSPC
jgi:hypothetical protein